jgi:hypothetical protein
VTSPGEPLSKVKTPFAEFLLTLFVRARWQIDLRRRSKWTENDCFDEI